MQQVTTQFYRSLLFVPVLVKRRVNKAAGLHADTIILDLEASIPLAQKQEARDKAPEVADFLRAAGKSVMIRINRANAEDAVMAAAADIDGLVVPVVEQPDDIYGIINAIRAAGLTAPPLLPIIETPRGLLNLSELISIDAGVCGLAFGAEDFVQVMGSRALPCADLLFNGAWQVAVTARAYGIKPYGIAGSLVDFNDLDTYRTLCEQARRIGMVGCPAIHPGQLDVLNEVFSASPAELSYASRAIAEFEAAGEKAIAVEGRLVDYPIYFRFKQLLEEYGQA